MPKTGRWVRPASKDPPATASPRARSAARGCRLLFTADRRAGQARRRTAMTRFRRLGSLALGALLLAAAAAPADKRPHAFKGAGHFTSATDIVSQGTATHLGLFDE